MSTGFRLFLLMVLAFAAVWTYQQRSGDLLSWLDAPRKVKELSLPDEPLRSPVEGVDGIRLYEISYRGPEALVEPVIEPEDAAPSHGMARALRPSLYADPGPGEWDEAEEPTFDTFPPADDLGGADRAGPDGAPDGPGGEVLDAAAFSGGVDAPLDGVDARQGAVLSLEDGHRAGGGEPGERRSDAAASARVYEVQQGDSLCKIAREILGKESRYREIEALNADILKGSILIRPGMKLLLPPVPGGRQTP
ncbi:MAG: LysM peptidoglycan-binding domain-containing protein [Planctomycetes bacterium]|nr:LysM peptidoglycan-binding domain-containing protein [Planctomycetota bacterium]